MDINVKTSTLLPLLNYRPQATEGDFFQENQVKQNWTLDNNDTVSLYSLPSVDFEFTYPGKNSSDPPKDYTLDGNENNSEINNNSIDAAKTDADDSKNIPVPGQTKKNGEELTINEKMEIHKLKHRDREIRTHEMSHLSAAGAFAQSGASYEYQRGPDGKNYAIHGHVMIDSSKAATPEATIRKMKIVRKAALAPVSPSPQDLKVAASASRRMVDASQEVRYQKLEEAKNDLKRINRKDESINKKIQENQQETKGKPPLPLSKDDEIPNYNTQTSATPKFNVNSFRKYSINIAQYQYDSLTLIV